MIAHPDFQIASAGRAAEPLSLAVDALVIAGWTGRDAGAVEAHIAELEAIGVSRPARVPCFYRVSAALLTPAGTIQVCGTGSTGEAEVVLVGSAGGLLVGVGSDHTDREVERYSITMSKQVCAKPVSGTLWRFEDVAERWDTLTLRSWTVDGGRRRLYQEGALAAMLRPEDLIGRWRPGARTLPAGTAMFCGTLPALAPIAFAPRFEIELADPGTGASIAHGYDVAPLPLEV